MVSDLASEGDLFSWCSVPSSHAPGLAREAVVLPFAMQILDAVQRLHALGIVHGDLSLENILLAHGLGSEAPRVQLIDFGMASTCRIRHRRVSKPSYQAPEMHSEPEPLEYDGFQSDAFALGVVIYTLLMQDYPWVSTRPGVCKCFAFCRRFGFRDFVKKRSIRGGTTKVIQHMSEPFLRLLEGLLSPNPEKRFTLNEDPRGEAGGRRSIWHEPLCEYGRRFLVAD